MPILKLTLKKNEAMAKQEITQKKIDGQVEEMELTTTGESVDGNMEDYACLLSPQEGGTTPRLRFKGFVEEWKIVELCDCLTVCKERNLNEIYGKADVLSVSDDFGVVNQIELLGRSFAGKSVANYRILKHGDIVYTKSPLKAKPFGIIKVNNGKTGIVSTLYAVYTPKEGISTNFINYYFAPSYRMNSYIHPLVNKGAKNDMKVSDENVLKGTISIPSTFEEQERIASFFYELEEKLTIHQQKLERLKRMKTACLHSMFPQNGKNLPLIRFKGFEGEWITVLLKDICEINPKSMLPELFEYVDLESVVGTDLVSHRTEEKRTAPSRAQRLAQDGDIFFQTVRPYQRNNYLFRTKEKPYVFSTGYAQLRTSIDEGFLFTALQTDTFVNQVLDNCTGSSYPAINTTALSNLYIPITTDANEQRRIASFFRSLDKKISLQTQQIEKLKQLKSACLNKMIA